MKLIDAIKQTGSPYKIPDCTRTQLPEFFTQMGYKRGAEIGVYKGEYTEHFLKAGLEMFVIDPWKVYDDYKHPQGQARMDFLYGHARRKLKDFNKVTFIRLTSMDALKYFEDESLDFVYIDGYHHIKYVIEDIHEWSKKVRKGGIISGHDYGTNKKDPKDPFTLHCKIAIDAYTKACQINNWYVLGSDEKKEGELRETWRSWFWIK